MDRDVISDERQLLDFLEPLLKLDFTGDKWILEIEDKIIDFELTLPLSDSAKNALEAVKLIHPIDEYSFHFKNCQFKQDLYIKDRAKASDDTFDYFDKSKIDYEFFDCEFENDEIRIGKTNKNITFVGNKPFTKLLNLEGSELNGKIRFRECIFKNINFSNTKFNDLADFWNCTFTLKTIFYKSDFYGNAVFSSATFKENVLFTYTLIDKVIIFRGTTFEKGLDLSTAIITGTISYFDVDLSYFDSITKKINKTQYEHYISKKGEIPIINKRETYRILKKNYESLNNNSESLEIKELEMRTLLHETKYKIRHGKNGWKKIPNYILLILNKYSNNYGNSYIRGAIFTFLTSVPFFYFSSINTSLFESYHCIDWNSLTESSKYFWQFILPTHRFDYFGANTEYSTFFYFFDFFGRIAVGYGIYQTIQAFRKYK